MKLAVTKIRKSIAAALVPAATLAVWIWSSPAAQAVTTSLKSLGGNMGFATGTEPKPYEMAGNIIGSVLALLGIIFTILVIYAGFLWMTAQGNEEQIGKAKKMITNAVVGIIITAMAYTISSFVIAALPT
jgi:heme/copper-type cytochrome/quinol oxidase subunit 2